MAVSTLPSGFERLEDGRLRPPQMFAGAGLDEQFWDDGFFHVPVLDAAALADLATRFDQLRPADRFDPTQADGARCSYHCTFLDTDTGYRRAADELVRDVFADKLRAVIPGYEILTSNIYVKPPGHGRFEIHQNWPTIEDLEIPTITVWIPLQDTSFDNGTIRIVRGSHHIFPDVSAATSDRFFDDFETELIESYLEPVPVRGGEGLVFDDSLLHWSSANRSTQARVTFQIELIPRDVRAVLWVRSPEDDTQFDLWEIDKEYWIEYPMESVFTGPQDRAHLGRRANPNRRVTLEEFDDRLARGDEIRRARYALG